LFAAYVIKAKGHQVLYLGQNTPREDLKAVYRLHKPQYLVTVITTSPSQDNVQEYLDELAQNFQDSEIIVSGYQIVGQDLNFPKNVRALHYIRQLRDFVEEINEVMVEK
jgi:methanogenic corrinoid protein MtbC1